MNSFRILVPAVLFTLCLSACGNNPDNQGGSTPIDSTNLHGTAPATYGADDPANPNPPRYEGQFDTGMQPNTMSAEDSLNMQQK